MKTIHIESPSIRKDVVRISLDHGAQGGKPRISVFDPMTDTETWVNVYEDDTQAFTAMRTIGDVYARLGRKVVVKIA